MNTITIFSLPKPFIRPHVARIQRNAIASWAALPGAEVFLMGTDEGIKEVAAEFGCTYIPEVAINEFGTPLLNSAFEIAHARAQSPWVMYINGDILLPDTFTDILSKLPLAPLLAVGQRTDIDLFPHEHALDPAARDSLFKRAEKDGVLHSVQGIDYFLFRKGEYPAMPPFAIGRTSFDAWILWAARHNGMKLIDLTAVARVVHQNHPREPQNAMAARKEGPETRRNIGFVKKKAHFFTTADATWKLTPRGLQRNWWFWYPYIKRIIRSWIYT